MAEQGRGRYATEPIYNIKAVVQKTGIPADTVRAWERRYGVPHPQRTETGRRLYSEHDIAAIRWLRERTAAGMTISQAILQLRSLGEEAFAESPPGQDRGPRNPEVLAGELLTALLSFDETAASTIVGEAFALYRVEDVCMEIFSPVLVEIGERWHRKEATVAQEHFSSHFIQRRLTSLLQAYAPTVGRGRIVTACAPDELHELGILMLSVFLVRRAWQVVYLGANVPIADLVQTAARLQPALVCISATNARTAQTLIGAVGAVNQLPPPRPLVAFGGAPFNEDEALRAQVHGHFLGTDARQSVERIEHLLS
jgi:MerR family transcriptional regulator, light-induced transcriptional regulator